MRFLVTAGSTREKIDSVRIWGNIFTGNTGLSIARAIAEVGEVDLLTSNRAHVAELGGMQSTPDRINAAGFEAHADLREALALRMRQNVYDAVFMSAAVSDYTPVRTFAVVRREPAESGGLENWVVQDVQAGKVKSNHGMIAVLGEQTEKLVDLFRTQWSHRGMLVKFKLEVGISRDALIRVGQASRVSSGAEYLIANTLEMVDGPEAGAFLLSDQGEEWVPRAQLAPRMVQLVSNLPGAKT